MSTMSWRRLQSFRKVTEGGLVRRSWVNGSEERYGNLPWGSVWDGEGYRNTNVLVIHSMWFIRKISVILLTLIGDGWKTKKYSIYTIWGLNLIIFLGKKVFLVLFCSRRTAYIVRDNAKKIYYHIRFILKGRIIIFRNILRVRCSLRKSK